MTRSWSKSPYPVSSSRRTKDASTPREDDLASREDQDPKNFCTEWSVYGSRKRKGEPKDKGIKREPKLERNLINVQEDQSDISLPREKAERDAPIPLGITPRKPKRAYIYLCCLPSRQSLSPSPYLHGHNDEAARSNFASSYPSSYPVGGGNSKLPDRVVRRDSLDKSTFARHNVEPTKRNLLLPQPAHNVLDILIRKADHGQLRRCLVLELAAEVNIMDDEVFKFLNLEKEPCNLTTPLSIPGQADLKPTGKVNCRWSIWGKTHSYVTSFLVVSGCDFDVMIGRHSIMELQLYQ